jgi:adenylosuccinate synthase
MKKFKNAFSVIGLGFGDEGKGTAVDYLSYKNPNSIVYRHSGGHQVGHTVKIGDVLHEFRHFGSGTFRGVPTLWGKDCTISPLQFEIEYNELRNFNISPILFYNEHCPITTLYDIAYNRAKEKQYKCGSTGVGFAATIKRHEFVPLFAMDLNYSFVLKEKMRNIKSYYFQKVENEGISEFYSNELGELCNANYTYDVFIESCNFFIEHAINDRYVNYSMINTIIYEGNQGILLDKYHGFYPNVTYGFTTNRNVECDYLNTFYVTRCYATRHGRGVLANENLGEPVLKNTEFEQNHKNPWQDDFRTSILDYDMIKYALECDNSYNKNKQSNLLITCMDQIDEPKVIIGGKQEDLKPSTFEDLVDRIYINDSPESSTIKLWE